MLLAAPDLVLALDVDKILAGDARILERLYIVGDVHRSKHVVGAVDKPSETLTRPCGQVVVVDEDVVAHTHLGDDDLGTRPGTSAVYSRSNPTTLYFSSASNNSMMWMECSTQTGSLVYTTEMSMNLLWVSTTALMVNCFSSSAVARSAIGAAHDTL